MPNNQCLIAHFWALLLTTMVDAGYYWKQYSLQYTKCHGCAFTRYLVVIGYVTNTVELFGSSWSESPHICYPTIQASSLCCWGVSNTGAISLYAPPMTNISKVSCQCKPIMNSLFLIVNSEWQMPTVSVVCPQMVSVLEVDTHDYQRSSNMLVTSRSSTSPTIINHG